MNLYDLVKRNDRHLRVLSGSATSDTQPINRSAMRCVKLAVGTKMILARANEVEVIRSGSGWYAWAQIVGSLSGNGEFRVSAVTPSGPPQIVSTIAQFAAEEPKTTLPIRILEERFQKIGQAFDLVFEAIGGDVDLVVGPLQSPREFILSGLSGQGVELGPGLNPSVLPKPDLEVTYIEQTDPDEWEKLYNAQGRAAAIPTELRQRYLIDSAVSPTQFAPCSLDFVFSNHVCEHFPNFGQVLKNWSPLIKQGGQFCGVVPDCRYSFDYRQEPSKLADIVSWELTGGFEVPDASYEKWCRYTEPNHTMSALKARGYSIHVNYFTPTVLADIFQHYCSLGYFQSFKLWCHRNGRDIGFALYA